MHVEVFPSDHEGAVSFYRLLEPMRVLRALGHNVTVGKPFCGVPSFRGDVLVFSRPADRYVLDSIRMCVQAGRTVVVEVDDDLINIPTDNVAFSLSDPARSPDRNWRHLVEAMRLAQLVTVTTPRLAQLYSQVAGHQRFAVLPNCVPERYMSIDGDKEDRLQIGWTGTAATHAGDLAAAAPGLRQVLEEHPEVDFRVVGTGKQVQQRLGLPRKVNACGWVPLGVYPKAMATIDIGIVPLRRDTFNQSKSDLKGKEFGSLGVPFVATPTEPYRQLAGYGAGLLAERTTDWLKHLRRLVGDPDYRRDRAQAGREAVAKWTYEERALDWWEAWASAHDERTHP